MHHTPSYLHRLLSTKSKFLVADITLVICSSEASISCLWCCCLQVVVVVCRRHRQERGVQEVEHEHYDDPARVLLGHDYMNMTNR